jgi:hypothetical protein
MSQQNKIAELIDSDGGSYSPPIGNYFNIMKNSRSYAMQFIISKSLNKCLEKTSDFLRYFDIVDQESFYAKRLIFFLEPILMTNNFIYKQDNF